MKTLLFLLLLPTLALAAPPAPAGFITVKDPGNPPDRNGLGAVAAPYRISKERVTQAEYAAFLNATDPTGKNELRLYNPEMAATKGGILLSPDAPEGSKYAPRDATEGGTSPVLLVNWSQAARYVNWLCNGATPGAPTETGAYDLTASNGARTARTPGCAYWIPDENEWYKAAFYRPGADGKAAYAKETEWKESLSADRRLVTEITSPTSAANPLDPEAAPPEAVAEQLEGEAPLRFSADLPPDAENESALQGFRIATTLPEEEPADGKAVLSPVAEGKETAPLEPVAEGPGGSSFGGPGYLGPGFSNAPVNWFQPIIVTDDDDDDDDDAPSS